MPPFTKICYSKEKLWNKNIDIKNLPLCESWNNIFQILFSDKRINILQNKINKYILEQNSKLLYPKPNYLFKAFNMCPFDEIKVVFIGQDPYFNKEIYKENIVPQAYGLSFSVPINFEIPSSLKNIYINLKKYNHIKNIPTHGCLDYWAYQGCLMMNSALTVVDGQKNCHSNEWKWFTNRIIEEISTRCNKVIFVLWGGEAYKKIEFINLNKHHTIISSHPSGLSANKKFKSYPAFLNQDHFGLINSHLTHPIDWSLPEYSFDISNDDLNKDLNK